MKSDRLRASLAAILALLSATPASAQQTTSPQTQAAPAPGDEALGLARTLVERLGIAGPAAMNGMTLPVPAIMKQIGVAGPEQGKVVYNQAVLPILMDHAEDFTAIEVRSYAAHMSVEAMKAAIAFYDTDAGKALIRARDPVFKANMAAVMAYLPSLLPEMKSKAADVMKAHGWSKG